MNISIFVLFINKRRMKNRAITCLKSGGSYRLMLCQIFLPGHWKLTLSLYMEHWVCQANILSSCSSIISLRHFQFNLISLDIILYNILYTQVIKSDGQILLEPMVSAPNPIKSGDRTRFRETNFLTDPNEGSVSKFFSYLTRSDRIHSPR